MLTHLLLNLTLMGAEWVLWVLLGLSLLSIAIVVERFWYFRTHELDIPNFTSTLFSHLQAGEVTAARELAHQSEAIECVVLSAGLSVINRGASACHEAMLGAKARERTKLESRLSILGTLGNNAPFIGLLGTVLGIIKAATDLNAGTTGKSDPSAVMSGVFESLVATAVGLMVAIPAVIFFNFFQRKVRVKLAQVDSLAHFLLATIRTDRKPETKLPAAQKVT